MPRLPQIPEEFADADTLLEAFMDYCAELGIELYEAQEEAIYALLEGDNTIVATPTGSGKSMVALAAHFFAASRGIRSFYTAPIKALVSEKFFALSAAFGPEQVGMITGDSSVNPHAPIICATAEILANQALREGGTLDVGCVVMDEFHYFADPARGWAWQVPLTEMPQTQFVLMSATLGDTTHIAADLTNVTGRETTTVASATRPVPLEFDYTFDPLPELLPKLVARDRAPIYVVSFAQAQAVNVATAIANTNLLSKEEREVLAGEIAGFRFSKGFGVALKRLLLHGIGIHHAGMLPKYRRLVEVLAAAGLLKVISGTDTLGVGINVPIRTVVFTGLAKFDGSRMRRLKVREFLQIAGRAGRAGFDTRGYVVAQAPEHEIENHKAVVKAGDNPKKLKKLTRKKAPAGFVSWSEKTFEQLTSNPPEELTSRMRITHSVVVNLLSRPHAGVQTVRAFIDRSHESEAAKLDMYLKALRIGQVLLASGVLERVETDRGVEFRTSEDLGPNFALNQPLSPFALAALELFDPEGEDWVRNVLSVIESTTQIHFSILKGQRDKIRGEEIAALKAEGVEYSERMAIIEDIDHPKPNAEVLQEAFDAYARTSPWVTEVGIEPKSVVSDMRDQAMTFSQFVAYYGLSRVEGSVLRYLTDVYRSLVQTVPEDLMTEELAEVVSWLADLIARVDSSLVEEWAALAAAGNEVEDPVFDTHALPLSKDTAKLTRMVRNTLFHRVLLAERADYAQLGELDAENGFSARDWEEAIEAFYDEYGELLIDAEARSAKFVTLTRGETSWEARQVLVDPQGDHDWAITARIDLAATDEAGEPAVEILSVGEFTSRRAG